MSPEPTFVAGDGTPTGRHLLALLRSRGVAATGDREQGLALSDGAAVETFFARERPRRVVYVGASEAGIGGNLARPADLMLQNLLAQTHVLGAALRHGVQHLLFLGSSCSYPRDAPQPMRPEHLFTGPVEPTSAPYATARLAGLVLCGAIRAQHGRPWIRAIPANPFGPEDHLDPGEAHVVAALMRRCWEADRRGDGEVVVWGDGTARRELLFGPDLASACLFLLERYDGEAPLNVGSGQVVSIRELAETIRDLTGFRGTLRFDPSRPGGAPVKHLDSTPLQRLGWRTPTPLPEALARTWAGIRTRLEVEARAPGTDSPAPGA